MKNVFTFCCALCLLALTACGSAPKSSEEASDLEVNNHEGVTMTVVDGSAYPGQVKVTILNATDTEIDSGNSADFFLQVEQNGQWYNLIPKQKEYDNTAEGYIYNEDTPGEMTFQWAFNSAIKLSNPSLSFFRHCSESSSKERTLNFCGTTSFVFSHSPTLSAYSSDTGSA